MSEVRTNLGYPHLSSDARLLASRNHGRSCSHSCCCCLRRHSCFCHHLMPPFPERHTQELAERSARTPLQSPAVSKTQTLFGGAGVSRPRHEMGGRCVSRRAWGKHAPLTRSTLDPDEDDEDDVVITLVFQPPASTMHAKLKVPRVPRVLRAFRVSSAPSCPHEGHRYQDAVTLAAQSSTRGPPRRVDIMEPRLSAQAGSPSLFAWGSHCTLQPAERLANSIVSSDWTGLVLRGRGYGIWISSRPMWVRGLDPSWPLPSEPPNTVLASSTP